MAGVSRLTRKQLVREQTQHVQRIQETLTEANIGLDSALGLRAWTRRRGPIRPNFLIMSVRSRRSLGVRKVSALGILSEIGLLQGPVLPPAKTRRWIPT